MGETTLMVLVPSLESNEPTNLLVEVVAVVDIGGSGGVIREGGAVAADNDAAAADDDDDGDMAVDMVTPFACTFSRLRQNLFQ